MTSTVSKPADQDIESLSSDELLQKLNHAQVFAESDFPLTPHQIKFSYDLYLLTGTSNVASLEGPAGTGKTTVLSAFILAMVLQGYGPDQIAVTAPTHKAAHVLNEKIETLQAMYERSEMYSKFGRRVFPTATTIHRTLNLKPRRVSDTAKESFVQSRLPDLRKLVVLIVDECSMIGTELFDHIEQAQTRFDGLLLFSGDPYQLPPVNEKQLSKSFAAGKPFKLTEVLRHDGAILDLATKVRTMRYLPQIKPATGVNEKGETSEVATVDTETELLDAWLDELEQSKTPEDIIMLCWVNKNRRMFNRMARAKLFGMDAPEYQAGDKLVAIKPIMDPNDPKSDKIIYANNADILLTGAQEGFHLTPIEDGNTYTCWRLSTSTGYDIYVPDKTSNDQWLKDVSKLGKEISKDIETTKTAYEQGLRIRNNKSHPQGISDSKLRELKVAAAQAKSRWTSEYFPLKNAFADVDFGYAITIHKSQGSTYNTVYVFPDYLNSRNEVAPLLYVAVTRASRKVVHLFTGIKR